MTNSSTVSSSGNSLQLTLATGAFACCFAVFGSVSAMMPMLRQRLDLDPVQVSLAIAIPVLLGSLGRIPLGGLFIGIALASFSVGVGFVSRWFPLVLVIDSRARGCHGK